MSRPSHFDPRDLAGVCTHCKDQSRKRIPYFRDLTDLEIDSKIEQAIWCAYKLGLVYPNPKQEGQYIAYAHFHDRDVWFVVGENETRHKGDWVIVTVLVHKNKSFKEMFTHAEIRLGQAMGVAA